MIEIQDKSLCCGCEACVQVCPKQCIKFTRDKEGFFYPIVDTNICVNCGLCEKVCPVLNQSSERKPHNVYAAVNNDKKELLSSSSGGIFILLAKETLKRNGVVFGAKFDENWNVIHSFAETVDGIKSFMGSKYVQSRIGNSYQQAKHFLDEGRHVLFSGTPCQIAGLKYFLRRDYDNLVTVDIICHGVPSPRVWQMYLEEVKKDARKVKSSYLSSYKPHLSESDSHTFEDMIITNISFRDKQLSWQKFSFVLTLTEVLNDGKQNTVSLSHMHRDNPFMKAFLNNLILRPSCYHCPSKSGKSQSDITIADFWGIEKVLPQLDNIHGVGLMMLNSDKGVTFVEDIDVKRVAVNFEDAIIDNSPYYSSPQLNKSRKKFFAKLDRTSNLTNLIVNLTKPPFFLRFRIYLSLLKKYILKYSGMYNIKETHISS